MRIAIGSDHRGFDLKQSIIELITGSGNSYQDFGCDSTAPVDFPDIAEKVSRAVAAGDFRYGILVCSTGIGMSMAANKVSGIRAALCHNIFSARRARQHNDANILCLGAENTTEPIADIVKAFLTTAFEGGHHQPRLDKIREMEG